MNPGWYVDPNSSGQQRYWDGHHWTAHVQANPPASGPPAQRPVSGSPAVRSPAPGPGYSAGYGPMVTRPAYPVAAKSPGLSLLISFFLPGVGSMVNGDVGIGLAILSGYLISCVLVLLFIGIFGVLGFWIWGMVDAYAGAQRWNARHGIVS